MRKISLSSTRFSSVTIYPFHITAQCRKAFPLPGLNKLHHFGSHLKISFLIIHEHRANLLSRNLTYKYFQECDLGSWGDCGFLMKLQIHPGFGTTWLILELKHWSSSPAVTFCTHLSMALQDGQSYSPMSVNFSGNPDTEWAAVFLNVASRTGLSL